MAFTLDNQLSITEELYFKLVQKLSINFFFRCCRGKIEGEENLNKVKSGFILAANHSSYLDWLILYSVFKNKFDKEIIFLAKEKLFRNFIWRKLVKAAGCIVVSESGLSTSATKKTIKAIRNNAIIGIFPEGTRSPSGELLKAKDGLAKLALLAHCPIIPVGLEGFYDAWPRDHLFPKLLSNCTIRIGAPLLIDTINQKTAILNSITNTVMDNIGRLINKKYYYN